MRIKTADFIAAAATLAVAAGLLLRPAEVAEAIRQGLEACAGTLIPSMFPFMALAGFLAASPAAEVLSIPLRPVTKYVLRLPPELGASVLLSFAGGYPVGARTVSALLENKRIDEATASRMLCYCVNCSPPFVLTAVGAGMLGDSRAGVALLLAQTAATLVIGAAVSLRAKPHKAKTAPESVPIPAAFVSSVNGAAGATVNMCAFVALFSGLLAMAPAERMPAAASAVLAGVFEVTAGCLRASQMGGESAFLAASAAISFGGLAVLFQAAAMFRGHTVRFGPMLLARIAHIPLAMAVGLPLYRRYCAALTTSAPIRPPVLHTNQNTVAVTLCLLCMCAIITISDRGPELLAYLSSKRYNIHRGNQYGTRHRVHPRRSL